MSERQPITYVDAQPDLPQSDFAKRLAELRISRTFAEQSIANDNTRDQAHQRSSLRPHDKREPSMVEQERPYPAPRPTPDFAADVDAAIFEARWEADRRRAQHNQPTQPEKGERPMSDDNEARRRPE